MKKENVMGEHGIISIIGVIKHGKLSGGNSGKLRLTLQLLQFSS